MWTLLRYNAAQNYENLVIIIQVKVQNVRDHEQQIKIQ